MVHKSTVDEDKVGGDTLTIDILDEGKICKVTALGDNEGDMIGVTVGDIEKIMLVKTPGETMDLHLVINSENLILL